jgi:hypothetical protein
VHWKTCKVCGRSLALPDGSFAVVLGASWVLFSTEMEFDTVMGMLTCSEWVKRLGLSPVN